MNKLYIIKWMLSNDYVVSVCSFWDERSALEKIGKNPEWSFSVSEDNDIHKVWIAR